MKMVKFLAIAIVGLAFASCAKVETPTFKMEASDQMITFDTPIVSPATKAVTHGVVNSTTYPTANNFMVAAVWSSANFTTWGAATSYMTLQEVSKVAAGEGGANAAAGSWTTATPYYWPKQGYLSFLAYSPSSETGTIDGTKGIQFAGYTTKVDGTQVDLMYSNLQKDQTKAAHDYGTTYDGVQIDFNHALANVVFNLKTKEVYNNVEIKVQTISLKGILNNGSFDQNLGGAAAWTPTGTATNFDNIVETGNELTITNTAISSATHANIYDVLVMPQPFTNNIEIYIEYTIKHTGESAIPQTFTQKVNELTYFDHETDRTAAHQVSVSGFEMGKKYIYNIIFTLDQIYFSPEVIEWVPIYSSDIEPA